MHGETLKFVGVVLFHPAQAILQCDNGFRTNINMNYI